MAGFGALLILALHSTGCGRIDQARQCRGLAATVNPALDGIEQRSQSGADRPETLRELAGRYDGLALALSQQSFTDSELQRLIADYASLFRSVAHSLRALASARQQLERPREARIRGDLENLVRKEAALARRIDRVCHGS